MYIEYKDGTIRDSFKTVFKKYASYDDAYDELTAKDAMSLNEEIESALEDAGEDYDYEKGYQLVRDDFFLRGGDEEDF